MLAQRGCFERRPARFGFGDGLTYRGQMHEGDRLGRYRLAHRIGEGGVGVVYVGVDDDGRAYAVKVLKPHVAGDPEGRARLAREVGTLRRLRHPAIAEVVDADVNGPQPYIVTRYVPAPSLHRLVSERGPLSQAELIRLGNGMGQALGAIHAAGVVHRDLKPANVLMAEEPVLIDFGIAHVLDEARLTRAGMVMGTPGYLSPELISGADVGPGTDWWAWAATMAFAASGRPPFGGGRADVVLDRVRRGDADLCDVPAGLQSVLRRALNPDPAARPQPAELRVALLDLQSGVPAPIAQPSPTTALSHSTEQRAVRPAAADPWARPTTAPTRTMTAPPAAPRLVVQPPSVVRPGRTGSPAPPPRGIPARGRGAVIVPVVLCLLAGLVPLVVVGVSGALVTGVRAVDVAQTALLRRWHERGQSPQDAGWVALRLPWHLLSAAVRTVLLSLPALLIGCGVTYVAAVSSGGDVTLALPDLTPGPLSLGAFSAGAVIWWGPGGAEIRRGARAVVRKSTPGNATRIAVWVVAAIVLVSTLSVVLANAQNPSIVEWFPRQSQPFD
ncbi:MAG: serine/threonine protein kinase [Micrococcales bacterium]|nr:MAG: serine/threonine protein kinase [Micrococcales bacterium]PIE27140.1 MAG: serine/threonine protein kinase [Micrococcales bacterium]